MFYDEVKVSFKAGNGGDGCFSFAEPSMSPRVDLMAATVVWVAMCI
jgi:hypothetical protein